jgi:hypothetical protein
MKGVHYIASFLIPLILFTPAMCLSAQGDGGEQNAFLKCGVGARGIALGKALTASTDDASAGYWNPAGLTQVKHHEIIGMYSEPFQMVSDLGYHTLSLAIPTSSGCFALNVVYLDIEGMFYTVDITSAQIKDTDYNGFQIFGNHEVACLVSYATTPISRFSVGATLKGVQIKMLDQASGSYGLDLGFLYRLGKNIRLGLVAQDIFSTKLLGRRPEPRVKAGAALQIKGILASLDLETLPFAGAVEHFEYHAGVEVSVLGTFFLRGGYSSDTGEPTLGFGLDLGRISMDYVYGIHQDLGDTHRASAKLRF